jgi:hypothetical protein
MLSLIGSERRRLRFWLSRFHADAPFLLRQPFHRGVAKMLAASKVFHTHPKPRLAPLYIFQP